VTNKLLKGLGLSFVQMSHILPCYHLQNLNQDQRSKSCDTLLRSFGPLYVIKTRYNL